MALSLRPMRQEEWDSYLAHNIEEYAREIAENYEIDLDRARQSAQDQTNHRLNAGLQTPNFYAYCIEQETAAGRERIGQLGFSINREEEFAWLDDIELDEPYRGQGYGGEVLTLVEHALAAQGIHNLSLHVFGANQRAFRCYQKSGFKITGYNM
nr:GNAT family N-acetyltransferase [Caldilineaceae bacterium]